MASTNNAFMEEHKDFVLKLKFVGEGGKCLRNTIDATLILDVDWYILLLGANSSLGEKRSLPEDLTFVGFLFLFLLQIPRRSDV